MLGLSVSALAASRFVLTLMMLSALCTSVLAQSTAVNEITDPEPIIEVPANEPNDRAVAQRLTQIFSQIDALKAVTVKVQHGVVTLRGNTANDAAAMRAQGLAVRVSGVVDVENKIDRTLDLEGNVKPLVNLLSDWLTWAARAMPLILLAIVILALLAYGGYKLSNWESLWRRIAPNPFLADLLAQAVRVTCVVLGLVVALNLLGATALMGTILGGAGVLGLAIGFAVRDSLGNYISSVMLSLRQPFRANDLVRINDHLGVVVRLTSRATILLTEDGNQLRIPNSDVFQATILNYSRNPNRRLNFELGVDAQDDPFAAMATGLAPVKALPFILRDPPPSARIDAVGDSNIVIWFSAWINQRESDFHKSRSAAISAAKNALEAQGFSLPEPIYRLRFDQPAPWGGSDRSRDVGEPELPEPPRCGRSEQLPIEKDRVDVSPDTHLTEMIEAERAVGEDANLLDDTKPHE